MLRWVCLLLSIGTLAAKERPNVLIFLADNLGFNDIGIFGSPTAQTPNIDRLGHEGIKLNHWNSAAHLCSASRAALLTGKYPVRLGVYPGVFKPDSATGLSPDETTLAEYLKEEGYATAIVGKWHLGHRPDYLPTNQGFDSWLGIPYHMSGGSIDNRTCIFDTDESYWLPLFESETIVEQPVRIETLAEKYASYAKSFIEEATKSSDPFLLYVPFSHVHQLCAPKDWEEQSSCQWSAKSGFHSSFVDAVQEMDWIAGQILDTLDDVGASKDTIVFFTSDNGPWLAEQSCAGSKGPFEGRWLRDNVPDNCTACPKGYTAEPTADRPRRCTLEGTRFEVDGVHCGEDVGLGSVWEANLRMPALVRWPGHIEEASESSVMMSTLDIVPTVLSLLGIDSGSETLDGEDISPILLGDDDENSPERVLFFWRDGFSEGPLPDPYGRVDVAAVKIGQYKLWFYTRSAHLNPDSEVHHDPPLIFDILTDPAEAYPLSPDEYIDLIERAKREVLAHKQRVGMPAPLTLDRDEKYIPCSNPLLKCRTHDYSIDIR